MRPGIISRRNLLRWGAVRLAAPFVMTTTPWTRASAAPPADRLAWLRRGVNITAWFRFPASLDPAALRSYVGAITIERLRRAGFTFVRLPVDPALLAQPPVVTALESAIRRLTEGGLGVVVSLHPANWQLETREPDRLALHQAWRRLGPVLSRLGAARVMAELLNEPVFPNDPAGWQRLQHTVLATARATMPNTTVVLSGHDWSSIAGLGAMTPEADPNTVYTFHLYEPADLTSLAAWRQGVDRAALARLPFPVRDPASCERATAGTDPTTAGMMRYYCAQGWNEVRMRERIMAAADWGRRHGVPVFCGEFGAAVALNASARLAWLGAVRQACDGSGLGWALWGLDDVMGFGLPRPPAATVGLDAGVLRALGLAAA